MGERLQNGWLRFLAGDTATIAFWNLAFVAFIGSAGWMAKGVIERQLEPQCAETYRVSDPRLNAVLFLRDLEEEGHFDPELDKLEDFAWVYDGGQLRFMVTFEKGVYSAVACYADGIAEFRDLRTP